MTESQDRRSQRAHNRTAARHSTQPSVAMEALEAPEDGEGSAAVEEAEAGKAPEATEVVEVRELTEAMDTGVTRGRGSRAGVTGILLATSLA